MRHVVLGMGGVGGLLGAALGAAGEDVRFVARPSTVAGYPGTVELDSAVLGRLRAVIPATASLDPAAAPDVVWVTVKATGLQEALELLPPGVVGDALVLPLLNGIDHVELLRGRYPRVAAATIRVESERVGPGRIRQPSQFVRVEIAPVPGPGAGRPSGTPDGVVALLQQAGIEARLRPDETSMLWSKLVFLAPMALATSAFDAAVGQVRERPEFLGCQAEAVAVAQADGADVDAASLRAATTAAPGGMRSSMQKDVDHGREPELDAIAGPILRRGASRAIATPHTEDLVRRIRARIAGA